MAYEPVWAVGTKKPDTPEESALTISYIKRVFKKMGWGSVPVLYGGSVNGQNISDLVNIEKLDGVLVGHASLDPRHFSGIIASY